ncbi:hypothetical protein PQR15_03620 [Streptomyces lydicus]|nr:hypothetical protein [Streptomyces lydicus]
MVTFSEYAVVAVAEASEKLGLPAPAATARWPATSG